MKLTLSRDTFKRARFKLVFQYTALTLFIVLTLEISFYFIYSRNLYRNFDNSIKNRTYSIASILSTNQNLTQSGEFDFSRITDNPFQESSEVIQIMDSRGKVTFSIGDLNLLKYPVQADRFTTLKAIEVINNKEKEIPIRTYTQIVQSNEKVIGYVRVGRSYDELKETLKDFFLSLLLILPFILALTGFIAYRIARIILQPVERSYRELKQFTEDASHELKTPLAIIRTNIDVALAKKTVGIESLKDKMTIISHSVDRMARTISQMLLLSRIDSGNMRVQKDSINVNLLLEKIKEEFTDIVNKKGVSLELKTSKTIQFYANSFSLEHIVMNLVDNAINYTPPGGEVKISLSDSSEYIIISVKDTGIGIKTEDLPYIFNRFFRIDKSRNRRTGGAGLGLAIVKELTDLVNGRIEVKSAEGEGTIFRIYLPKVIGRYLP